MTNAMEPSPPESERPSQRRVAPHFFDSEERTKLLPPLEQQRREPLRPPQDTQPDVQDQLVDGVALIAFTTGEATGAVLRIEPQSSLTIGRSERCSFLLDDPTISRVHARLHRLDASVSLTDAGSTNGTFVNGRRVQEVVTLHSGDSVRLGTRHGFRFLLGDERELAALAAAYEHATHDTLTGLLNRRVFDQALEGEVSYARRHGSALSLLLIDVDHFKNVNDAHGHTIGDSVLRAIGEELRQVLRAEDIAARVGGEEFSVVVRDVDRTGVLGLADRLSTRVSDLHVTVGPAVVQVTVSIGIASLKDCDAPDGAAELLRIADARLYKAKAYRNCVVAD